MSRGLRGRRSLEVQLRHAIECRLRHGASRQRRAGLRPLEQSREAGPRKTGPQESRARCARRRHGPPESEAHANSGTGGSAVPREAVDRPDAPTFESRSRAQRSTDSGNCPLPKPRQNSPPSDPASISPSIRARKYGSHTGHAATIRCSSTKQAPVRRATQRRAPARPATRVARVRAGGGTGALAENGRPACIERRRSIRRASCGGRRRRDLQCRRMAARRTADTAGGRTPAGALAQDAQGGMGPANWTAEFETEPTAPHGGRISAHFRRRSRSSRRSAHSPGNRACGRMQNGPGASLHADDARGA